VQLHSNNTPINTQQGKELNMHKDQAHFQGAVTHVAWVPGGTKELAAAMCGPDYAHSTTTKWCM
jgi:hypothetical protein